MEEPNMPSENPHANKPERRDRLIRERVHDPYQPAKKPPEPTVCPVCGVLYHHGRWQWAGAAPAGAHQATCPACRRIADRLPAGLLRLSGDFFTAHRDEILRLVHNHVEAQRAEHPLKRLMSVSETVDGVEIAFTDTHLPHGVGEAVSRAYQGELETQYSDESNLVRVHWRR
jgi:NMD protein affecting ribosome stability and mRNA decay